MEPLEMPKTNINYKEIYSDPKYESEKYLREIIDYQEKLGDQKDPLELKEAQEKLAKIMAKSESSDYGQAA